eukprot:TRINITY_DN112069_c0_g1_i1.p1 TRINITY_DN112069_c0_g1~~TRINITY_DN112069_c0_g1_i1.p1  ORF type:complete len:111 (+),score=8.61 TRINITY_DN112069_c0_g1_i1:296-628(+)
MDVGVFQKVSRTNRLEKCLQRDEAEFLQGQLLHFHGLELSIQKKGKCGLSLYFYKRNQQRLISILQQHLLPMYHWKLGFENDPQIQEMEEFLYRLDLREFQQQINSGVQQ